MDNRLRNKIQTRIGRGMTSVEIAEELGCTKMQAAAVKAWNTMRGTPKVKVVAKKIGRPAKVKPFHLVKNLPAGTMELTLNKEPNIAYGKNFVHIEW